MTPGERVVMDRTGWRGTVLETDDRDGVPWVRVRWHVNDAEGWSPARLVSVSSQEGDA